MPRTRREASADTPPPLSAGIRLDLEIGPWRFRGEERSEQLLRAAWIAYGDEIMSDHSPGGLYTRPWGWWRFEAGEEPPSSRDEQAARLAELGVISEREIRFLRKRAGE